MKRSATPSLSTNSEVDSLFERVAGILEPGRGRVLRTINHETVLVYWLIGREIVQALQGGETRAQYGNALITDLSKRLTGHYGAGFSAANLKNFRQFYQTYSDRIVSISHPSGSQLAASNGLNPISCPAGSESPSGFHPNLSWSHYRALMRVENNAARQFYETEAVQSNWSRRDLERQIGRLFYERLLASTAKIAGIEMCWAYNRQYGTQYLAVMPTNLYGPGDNYDLNNSHVIPALIRKFHEAKVRGDKEVVVWGTGTPYREFLYSHDMADACVFLMNLDAARFQRVLDDGDGQLPPLVNIGTGVDLTIRELAEQVGEAVGFTGEIVFDASKPDGTPRKLLDVSRMGALGWQADLSLQDGLKCAYHDFMQHSAHQPV
ncbi:MAG: DUF1016 N-terminal domain-containing protein [Sulfuriferula sp.]